jgi:MFS family permease
MGAQTEERSMTAADPSYSRRWLILAVVGAAQVMVVLDTTVVNIARPSARRGLQASNGDRQWVVTACALAFGSLLPLGGRIGDLFGRKPTFLPASPPFLPSGVSLKASDGSWRR